MSIYQTNKGKYCIISLVSGILRKKKNNELTDTENRLVDARDRDKKDKMGERGQKVQTSSYKVSSGHVIYSMVTIVNNTVLYIGSC